ncbi:MAG TPA: type II toxin-antitoxin system RelE/ParE family toxin [Steroidobacteraceae bacterium]|nr:type II toxin-antitoxin system RelE/ParE family toxin [Steroidobacteraceae bacterium]
MRYQVRLTDDAASDLDELYLYIAQNDSPENAESVLTKIEQVLDSLSRTPKRGVYPKELVDLGIREYREVFFKPYRMIYRAIGRSVYVYLIADGGREMQSVLQRRLLIG